MTEEISLSGRQITVSGLLINYYAGNRTGRKNLIFLHGWRSESTVWFPLIKNINAPDSVYCIDLPGFGKSEIPDRAYDVADYSDVVSGFISKLGLKNVVIVGHSFGGRIAIKLASRHPDFLSGIVLADSAGFADKTILKKLKNIIAKPLSPVFRIKALRGVRKSIYRLIGAGDYVETPKLKETYLKTIGEDLSGDMAMISTPVFIIWGDNDKDTPPTYARRMQNLIHGAKVFIIKGAGHFSFLDKPLEFADALRQYLIRL